MNTLNEADKRMKLPEIQMWVAEVRTSNQMKYSNFYADFIQSLPKESALRLIRVHLQRDPRYAGDIISDELVESSYLWIINPAMME